MNLNALYKGRHYPPRALMGIEAHRHMKSSLAELEINRNLGSSHSLVLTLFPIQIPNPDCHTCYNIH